MPLTLAEEVIWCIMETMTDDIREEVRIAMVRQHMSQTALAAEVGLSQHHVSALLGGRRGRLPIGWQKVLDGLGLELVVRPKTRLTEPQ